MLSGKILSMLSDTVLSMLSGKICEYAGKVVVTLSGNAGRF